MFYVECEYSFFFLSLEEGVLIGGVCGRRSEEPQKSQRHIFLQLHHENNLRNVQNTRLQPFQLFQPRFPSHSKRIHPYGLAPVTLVWG